MMDETRFWAMIAGSWPKTKQVRRFQREVMAGELDDIDALDDLQDSMLEHLRAQLNQLDAAGLLAFDRILERKLYDIDRADIQKYTDGSDDGFLYCRGFIVSMGQEYYELVKQDPSRALMDAECEGLCYLSKWLYDEKYGPMPPSGISRETGSNTAGWDSE